MHPDINQRAAAGTFDIREPATRIAQTTQTGGFGIIDLAQLTLVDKLLQNLCIVAIAANKTDL
ncbi:hypothetical protein D3C76_1779740 [compost metagenome]